MRANEGLKEGIRFTFMPQGWGLRKSIREITRSLMAKEGGLDLQLCPKVGHLD